MTVLRVTLLLLMLLAALLFWQPIGLDSVRHPIQTLHQSGARPTPAAGSAHPGATPRAVPTRRIIPVHRLTPRHPTAIRPAAARPIPARYVRDPQARARRFNSGTPGGPPQPGQPGAGHALPLLHLPAILPDRTVNVPILMYHHVNSQPAPDILQYGLTVTDQDFTDQLKYLRKAGYHTILLTQLFAAMYHGAPLPRHPIILTFDDGYTDNYTDALPILRRFHDVADFNIISAYPGITLGVNTYMTWQQIKILVKDGMEIGSHTVDHQDLGLMSAHHARFELRDSRNILQEKLGVPVQVICYPSGEPFSTESTAAQSLLLQLIPQYGYVFGLLDGLPVTSLQNADRPYQLNRIRVAGGESLQGFIANLPW